MKHTLAASILAFLAGVSPALAQGAGTVPSEPVVVTTGQATVVAVPDRAFVTVTAESRSKNSAEAQKQNAEAMTAVLQKVQQAGVPKDAIRTIAYDLQPEFDYANGRQTFRSFVARNTVEVRLGNIDRVGAVIDAAATGGATSIGGVCFDVRNREGVEREALRLAVADARARADAAAVGAGRTIDRVIRIEEAGVPEYPRPMLRMAAADQAASTPITPSSVEIQARVTLTASLR
ncbi:MAG: DUF541 domain-containing protein [Acidobacteria bacterium]|nr:DUF541 domain-containing protein [Acidobacteriota bacterium]